MFEKKKEPLETFTFITGETGGCLAREPWINGRVWVFKDLDEFAAWVKDSVTLKQQ